MAVRIWQSERGPPLHLWHTYSPPELRASEIAKADWAAYLAAEQAALAGVRDQVTRKLPEEDRVAVNRYFEDSPLYPARFVRDWNRSYILEPVGDPVGAVVLLHGLTDGPFSARHFAEHYRDHGFVAVVIRLPGARHRAGRARARGLGGLGRGDPPCGPGGAPPRRSGKAAAPPRLFERRCARDEVRARSA